MTLSDNWLPTGAHSVPAESLVKGLRERRTLFATEGGVVYTGNFNGQPCIVTDEGTLEDFLPELGPILPRVRISESAPGREAFIMSSGWSTMRSMWRREQLGIVRDSVAKAYFEGGLEEVERSELFSNLDDFYRGEPVGGLLARDEGLLPQCLELWIGKTECAAWDGDAFRIDRQSMPGQVEVIQPTAQAWRSFWKAIGRLGVWGWESGTSDHRMDQDDWWRLHLVYRGREVDAEGPLGEEPSSSERFAGLQLGAICGHSTRARSPTRRPRIL